MVASSVALPPEGQVRRLVLFGKRGTVARCRDFTRAALQDWGWLPAGSWDPLDGPPDAKAEDVLLVVSELVTNACLHTDGPTELRLAATRELLRVEVSDPDPARPAPRSPHDGTRPGGHGLHIIARLCRGWGTTPAGPGKTVWAEVTRAERGRGR